MRHIALDKVGSTNSWLSERASSLEAPVIVSAFEQEQGRGQRGNSWESEPGKNLTFSILVRQESFPAIRQFYISEAVSLAIADTLNGMFDLNAKIKWPNDIYVGDRKICGILIEHSVSGKNLIHTIIGAGINLNQERFLSDAPNPVSVKILVGESVDIDCFRVICADNIMKRIGYLDSDENISRLHSEYLSFLWRADGQFHTFRHVRDNRLFEGKISDVEPLGYLNVLDADSGEIYKFAFKEVEFIL